MPFITRDNAKELSQKANVARWTKFHNPPPIVVEPAKNGNGQGNASQDEFVGGVISRVRKQIDSVLKMLSKESDPTALDKLSRSLGALCEQERRLSNRPMPGSLKPSNRQSRSSRSPLTQPEPVAEAQPEPGPEPGSISEDWKQFTG